MTQSKGQKYLEKLFILLINPLAKLKVAYKKYVKKTKEYVKYVL